MLNIRMKGKMTHMAMEIRKKHPLLKKQIQRKKMRKGMTATKMTMEMKAA